MRITVVGDVHATVEELAECRSLIEAIKAHALQHESKTVLFLGDLYHTHSVMRVEVMAFWVWAFQELKRAGLGVAVLLGNHDMAQGGQQRGHALLAHMSEVNVIDRPVVSGDVVLMPYYDDPEEFVKTCQQFPGHVLVCHQTFQGCKYENGFYAKDGVDPERLPHKLIISGHIHAPQKFGKVWYVGAPRWRSISDANTERFVWTLDLGYETRMVAALRTAGICRPIYHLEDRPEKPVELPADTLAADVRVDVYGPAEYLVRRNMELKAAGCRVRTFRTDAPQARAKESEGVWVAFQKYVAGYKPARGTPAATLQQMAESRLQLSPAA